MEKVILDGEKMTLITKLPDEAMDDTILIEENLEKTIEINDDLLEQLEATQKIMVDDIYE